MWIVFSGIPYALLAGCWARLSRRSPPALQPFVAAWLWTVVEVLRSLPPVGMPWGLLSQTQWRNLVLLQIAEVGGGYAVTFVVVATSVGLGLAARDLAGRTVTLRRGALRLLPVGALLGLAILFGYVRLTEGAAPHSSIEVAVAQAKPPPGLRWRRAALERQLLEYLELSRRVETGGAPLDLIVWPENAANFYLEREPTLFAPIAALARARGSRLLLGAPRLASPLSARNSAYLIESDGRIAGVYDKQVLVPLAELDPFAADGDERTDPSYAEGRAQQPLGAANLGIGTLICFEILHPQLVRALVDQGARLLVNVSNDSWLDDGTGSAPRQHFAMAVLRAVEARRALVRASAGGVSGFVSPLGIPSAVVPWQSTGASASTVELRDERTLYQRWGERWIVLVGIALLALTTLASRTRSA